MFEELLSNVTLPAPMLAQADTVPQPSGQGHLPTPSASTGWQYVGVISSLSRSSGTPSPSVSIGQPCVSTATPAGVPGHLSNWSVTPSPSESGRTGSGRII